jgi:polysaccharide biosynthesis/export protein
VSIRVLRLASLVVMAWTSLTGCPHAANQFNYAAEPDPRKKPYVLGVADRVRISVWQNADLSTDAVVRPDGTVTMPLVGDIRAVGMTPDQLRETVRRRLQEYLKGSIPTITVAVTDVASYRFTVSGAVFQGGTFNPGRYVTVMEAIAMAGGLTRFAKPDQIIVNRVDASGKVRRIPIDYEKISAGEALNQNIVILGGDCVYVP